MISWWRGWEPTCRRNTGIGKDMTGKGNKKGNIWGQIADFRRPPPGVVEPRGWRACAPLYLSNLFSE